MTAGLLRRVLYVSLVVSASSLSAQDGATAPFVVRTPVSVRALGMGGGWTASRDADAVFFNPAYAGLQSAFALGSGWYRSVASNGYGAASMPMGTRGMSLGAAWLEYGAPASGVPDASLGLRGPDDAFSLMGQVAGAMVFKGVRFGAAAKVVDERVGDDHDSRASFDVGAAKDLAFLSVGIAVQNIGPNVEVRHVGQEQPTRVTLGAQGGSLPLGPFDVGVSAAVSVLRDGFVTAAGGAEFVYVPLEGYTLAWRVGARRAPVTSLSPLTTGLSFGLDRFTIDYAFEDLKARGGGHHIGVRIR
jgi:hypothetical protein